MNERIKELYLQAVEYSNGQMTFGDTREFFAEKFAELIVQECMWQVVKDNQVPHDIQVLIGGRFKDHFGVEEK